MAQKDVRRLNKGDGMNILYLTGCLSIGGTELYTLDYAKTSRAAGQTVYWGTVKDGLFRETVEKEGIPLLYCELGKRSPFALIKAMNQIRRIVADYKINLIHATDAYSALVAALAFGRKKRSHVLVWSNVGIGSLSYMLMRKVCGNKIDGYIAVSHFIRNRMIEEGFDPARITVYSQNRATPEATKSREDTRANYGILPNDFVIGTVGRLVKLKGNHTVVDALQTVVKLHKNVKLLVIGDGPERQNLMERAQELQIAEHVIFAGFCTDIENLYPAFDLVVFPTHYEALGYIPYEAMYHQRPIIASRTGGVPELVIDEYNGLLVPPAMPELWADAILRLIDDATLREKMVENGTDFYEKYLSRSNCEEKLRAVYGQFVTNREER